MVYQWKIPGIYDVDANVAGNELERIHRKNGELKPKDVVDESRPLNAPLHGCFEWNDRVAAEKYRERQAGDIIRSVVVVQEKTTPKEPVKVRAFVHTSKEYQPIRIVMDDEKLREELLKAAKRDMDAFRKKYKNLEEMKPVFEAFEQVFLEEAI